MAVTLLHPTIDAAERFVAPARPAGKARTGVLGAENALARRCMR